MPDLVEFASTLLEPLASDNFFRGLSLLGYLSLPSDTREGDEAEVVDMLIATRLLDALGYSEGERGYNRLKDGARPDFAIRINEYPGRPCFVLEDKASSEASLSKHKQQLSNYLASTHAPRGILLNGATLLGYDNIGPMLVPTLSLSIVDLVAHWRGEGDLFTGDVSGYEALLEHERRALGVLQQRYSREGFAGLQRLIDDFTLQRTERLDDSPEPHAADGSTWVNGRTRIQIVSAADDPEALTRAVRELIVELEMDVAVQFDAFSTRYAEFLERSAFLPGAETPYDVKSNAFAENLSQLLPAARATSDERAALLRRLKNVLFHESPLSSLRSLEADVCGLLGIASAAQLPALDRLLSDVRHWSQRRAAQLRHLEPLFAEELRLRRLYEVWKTQTSMLVVQTGDEALLRREFFAQTSYLVIVRMLLVRIIEDKGLSNRMFTNGGAAVWFRNVEPHYFAQAIGQSPEHLLSIAFQAAQQTYAHFYGESGVFDWYRPDRNMVVRILHVLAGFDLHEIDRDIIGAVYNGYVEEEHKHESGLYYTPPEVIEYILDRVGYSGTSPLQGRLLDLSSGSGAFLVAAGRRLIAAHVEYWLGEGHQEIPADQIPGVVRAYRDALFGIDINPFACALAELNLLIQILDLLHRARTAGFAVQIDRFNIYNHDSLSHSAETRATLGGSLPFPAEELPINDQITTGTGLFADKFLFIVGNPPYVRADEQVVGLTEYRTMVKEHHPIAEVRDVCVKKWDLYIPFVALAVALLSENGRLGMIVSSAFEVVPYAEELRKLLVARTAVIEVSFFPDVRLFSDAAVENTIIIARSGIVGEHDVLRRWHTGAPPAVAREQHLSQISYGQELFRQTLPSVKIRPDIPTVSLADLCYISKGMALHANERHHPGEFIVEDLVSDEHDETHPAPFVYSRDIDEYGPRRVRYLEYGPDLRAPSRVDRPTFAELYDRPKLMIGEFGGFAFDDGNWDTNGFLKCNHSVFLLMPWRHLRQVQNSSLTRELGNRDRGTLEVLSSRVTELYLLALLNSQLFKEILLSRGRSAIQGRFQPDDLRSLEIPLPDNLVVQRVSAAATEAVRLARIVLAYCKDGWEIDEDDVVGPTAAAGFVECAPISTARVLWGLHVHADGSPVADLRRVGRKLLRRNRQVLSIAETVPEEALEWLRRQFNEAPAGSTLGSLIAQDISIARTPAIAVEAVDRLEASEHEARGVIAALAASKASIEQELSNLAEVIEHPAIVDAGQATIP